SSRNPTGQQGNEFVLVQSRWRPDQLPGDRRIDGTARGPQGPDGRYQRQRRSRGPWASSEGAEAALLSVAGRVEKGSAFQLVEPWQVIQRPQSKMVQEGRRGHPRNGPSWRLAATLGRDPTRFDKQIKRSLAKRHSARGLNLGACDGLLVSNYG